MAIYLWSYGRIILFRCTSAQCVILIKQVFNIKKFQDHPDTLKNQTKFSSLKILRGLFKVHQSGEARGTKAGRNCATPLPPPGGTRNLLGKQELNFS